MSDGFIGIHDGAPTQDQCAHIVERCEASDKPMRGRTGMRVDVAQKDSRDITISPPKEWHDMCNLMAMAARRHLAD